jgi:hypothetical protein
LNLELSIINPFRDGAAGEGIAVDSAGNFFTAEATVRGITKYVKE